jgi:hypothetical protein
MTNINRLTPMKTHHTEQAARGLLMYKLAIRDYTIQFTDSRFPTEDLLCISPNGKHFGIDIKGQRTGSFWLMNEPKINPDLFYAFVYVPPIDKPRVFIMDSATTYKIWMEYKDGALERDRVKEIKRKPSAYLWGLNWKTPFDFEDRYDLLPR